MAQSAISNRSVPVDTVLPHLAYENVTRAIAWLTEAFGFAEHYRYGEPVSGAQMRAGKAWIMLHQARLGSGKQNLTIFIDDLDLHFQRAQSAGAKIVEELHETVYGERQYAAEDLEGHRWIFSKHARDLSPEDWGATIATLL